MALELQGIQTGSEVQERFLVGAEPRKKLYVIRIDAPLSRQPLVKGERLVRFEVSAAMPWRDKKITPDTGKRMQNMSFIKHEFRFRATTARAFKL